VNAATRIVLIDEHQTFLDLLTFAINAEDDLTVIGAARTAAEGRDVVERTRPDLVLIESVLPDEDGVAVAGALVDRHPGLRVVLLTAAEDVTLIARAAAAGAAAFLAKSGALAQVINTIRTARRGSLIVDPLYLARLEPALSRPGPAQSAEPPRPALTAREFDVLSRLDQGKDPRTIARELSISLHTCRGYVKNLLAKLDSHSQLEAVVTARRLGLLTDLSRILRAG
jgi:DNA-binding NarL/FixJ family response regulator